MLAERLVAAENDSSARATSLVAIGRGWPVVDRDGNVLGQVVRVHGEPELGVVSSITFSAAPLFPYVDVSADKIARVESGRVRVR